MTAREDLIAAVGGDPKEAEALINAYARELAQTLRRFGHYMASDRIQETHK